MSEIIHQTANKNLYFTGAGTLSLPSGFSFDDLVFTGFLEEVKAGFDMVLFDTPAVSYIPDTIDFMNYLDAILIVVRLRLTSRNELDRFLKMVKIYQSKIAGTIINDVKMTVMDRYSNYRYYTYYSKDENQSPKTGENKRNHEYRFYQNSNN